MSRHQPVILLILALLGSAEPAVAQRTDWPLADRSVIGDGSVVTAVAAAVDRVLVCTPGGVLSLDPIGRRWIGPYQAPDPGALSRARAALLDPLDQSLWIQLPAGWLRFEPTLELWEQGVAPGPITQIAFDADNPTSGLFLLIGASWYQVPRGSQFPIPASAPRRPVKPLTFQDLMNQAVGLAGMSGGVFTDPRGRPARITSAAADPTGRGWWVGTAGVGLLFLAYGQAIPERVPYGLPSASTAAVYAVPQGVWIATDQLNGQSPALSFLSSDLATARSNEGPMATGLPFHAVFKMTGLGSSLWLGTDVGLLKFTDDGHRVERFDEGRGLPDARVYTVLARRGRVLAGTAHGLVAVDDSGRVSRLGPNFVDRVDALETVGDTVWVGGPRGPMILPPGREQLEWPNGLDAAPAFRAPVLAMGRLGDTIVALTTERLEWRDPGTGAWSLGPMLESSLGRLLTMVTWHGGAFVAGDHAVAFVRLGALPAQPLSVPSEIPAPPRDLAIDDQYLWVATSQGLVRWRLEAIAP
jgi:hypothetical protein